MKKRDSGLHLVFIGKKDEVYTTSEIIAKHAEVQHHTITKLIQQYEMDLLEFGGVRFEIEARKTNGGIQSVKVYHLNEQQATLLMTYLRNNEIVRGFKKELVRQFYAMRGIIWKQKYERQTESWQTARIEGKKARRLETDTIKMFVEYAQAQGSKRPDKYYMIFTKLANQVVGITTGDRDGCSTTQLLDLRTVEHVIDRAILHEISNHEEYHKAYQNVKAKVFQVAALALDNGLSLTA